MASDGSLSRRGKIALVATLVLIAAVVGFLIWFECYAEHRWSSMCERARRLHKEALARNPSRPVLRGEPLPGNAWDEYELAVNAARGFTPGERDRILEFARGDAQCTRASIDPILALHSTLLEHLQQGARCEKARRPHAMDANAGLPLNGCQWLANLAVCKARVLEEDGDHRQAAELMLDTCRFGHDLGLDNTSTSELWGLMVANSALSQLREVVLSRRLTKEDLLEIERELGILDQSLPSLGHSFVNGQIAVQAEFADLGPSLERVNSWRSDPPSFTEKVESFLGNKPLQKSDYPKFSRWDAWRYGFSLRLMIVDALEQQEKTTRVIVESEALPWKSEKAAWEAFRPKSSRNPLLAEGYGKWIPGSTPRTHRAKIRLLQEAAHFLATGQVLELDDPFGSKLLHAEAGGKLRIWSIGRDAADDSGQGDWKSESPDIVLELPK